GETLLQEGDDATELFVVVRGRVAVLKSAHGAEHMIHEIGAGEVVGEVSLFDGKGRSATVRALEPCKIVALPFDAVRAAPTLTSRLSARIAERLRISSEDELQSAQRRAVMGELVVKVVSLLCLYALLLSALERFDIGTKSTTYISLPLIGVFGWGSWRFIRNTGYPMAEFGLGVRGLVMSLVESVVLTPPFCAVLVGLKWIAIHAIGSWREAPLFERRDWLARLSEPAVIKLLVVYFVSSAVQELIVRSALQASLEGFLVGKRARATTIFVCAAMFAVNHLHMSFEFAAAAFIPGVLWGWMFSRRRHLIGPVLSHFAVGAFVFFVLGVRMP
ncbi:MAG: cyclic nucleotide-binding domain-containing protein, partial [Myxococcales bacterium]|nr:cyclic nucleotide-binding domain-containing protein [Myxococcales bacterium]